MGKIVLGMASSHAYTFEDPADWDARRVRTQTNYKNRYGTMPADVPQVALEDPQENQVRFGSIRNGLEHLRDHLKALRPDVLIMIGDDQDENFREDNLPQFAIYTGGEFILSDRASKREVTYQCDTELAGQILEGCIDRDFDLASSNRMPGGSLTSHAHTQPLVFLDIEEEMAVIPVFVNAIHIPAPSPSRCYALGRAIGEVIALVGDNKRVALYASGGLSHFSAGYPWPHYDGPHTVGSIAVDYDRGLVDLMKKGSNHRFAELTQKDLIDNGEIELRQWIVLLGALGDQTPHHFAYEPFFRGVMGMAVSCWEP
ncbi:MAG: extradiol ring-cleavage dioxygenase [Chloroflexota bacterium]|nr:extradiol ring-cleavage dioxygenase [Chloroflexota bacterium]MDE2886083.1 extradiol ring-cleavage dioxygenase [Chloroflexota bacterium]